MDANSSTHNGNGQSRPPTRATRKQVRRASVAVAELREARARLELKKVQMQTQILAEQQRLIGFSNSQRGRRPQGKGLQEAIDYDGGGFSGQWGTYVDFNAAFQGAGGVDMPAGYSTISLPSDRQHGREWPIWYTITQLGRFRQASRVLCRTNAMAKGLLKNLQNYIIGTGFKYNAVAKDGVDGKADDVLLAVKQVQKSIDRFLGEPDKKTGMTPWSWREREGLRRTLRDGEAILRLFRRKDGLKVRWVEPEQLRDKPGVTFADGWSYGVQHYVDHGLDDGTGAFEDVETIVAYYIVYKADAAEGETVPAKDVVHIKNPGDDATVKRGLPEFIFDTWDAFNRAARLQKNLSKGAALQACIAWVEQFENATQASVQAYADGRSVGNNVDPTTGASQDVERWTPGTISRIPKSKQFLNPPWNEGLPNQSAVVQGDYRQGLAGFCAPEYFSGDCSNGDYSSTKEAGAPFVKEGETFQAYLRAPYSRIVWEAVHWDIERGVLPANILDLVTIQVEAAAILQKDPLIAAQTDQILVTACGKSRQTVLMENGLDPDIEQTNNAEWAERNPQAGDPGSNMGPGSDSGDSGPKMESALEQILREAGEGPKHKGKGPGGGQFTAGAGGGGGASADKPKKAPAKKAAPKTGASAGKATKGGLSKSYGTSGTMPKVGDSVRFYDGEGGLKPEEIRGIVHDVSPGSDRPIKITTRTGHQVFIDAYSARPDDGKNADEFQAKQDAAKAKAAAKAKPKEKPPEKAAEPAAAPADAHADKAATSILAKAGGALKAAGKAGKFIKGVTKSVYNKLEQRYGRKTAIAIFAAGTVLGVASPLVVIPGSTVLGMVPFAAMAETYLQAKKGINYLRGHEAVEAELDQEKIDQLGKELAEHLLKQWSERPEGSENEPTEEGKDASGHEHDNIGRFGAGSSGSSASGWTQAGRHKASDVIKAAQGTDQRIWTPNSNAPMKVVGEKGDKIYVLSLGHGATHGQVFEIDKKAAEEASQLRKPGAKVSVKSDVMHMGGQLAGDYKGGEGTVERVVDAPEGGKRIIVKLADGTVENVPAKNIGRPGQHKKNNGLNEKGEPTEEADETETGEVLDLPLVRQEHDYDCGAAAVRIVAEYFGVGEGNEQSYIDALGTTEEDGTPPNSIVEYLSGLGLHAEATDRMEVADLTRCVSEGMPVICCIQDYESDAKFIVDEESGHYIVVAGADDENVILQDPSAGRVTMPATEFLERWQDKTAEQDYVHFGIRVSKAA